MLTKKKLNVLINRCADGTVYPTCKGCPIPNCPHRTRKDVLDMEVLGKCLDKILEELRESCDVRTKGGLQID